MGRWGDGEMGSEFLSTVPDSRFPIPDSRFPFPSWEGLGVGSDSRFPIPDSPLPIPCSQFLQNHRDRIKLIFC
ncbi:hypothetical protein [Moorena sp. SIO4G3]|uniref:hypothetical protein n=1 Tax=Moorena sp. SIO4G3 TaxID=2607821 RepID=UPI00142923E9|nr:hypothetical protein [Moorena sp. SIO4G3]NEO82368.1 hypothetical protein [Moorena sp. SIO4G3]